eukprot:scaffold1343_cov45-Prasinocladus_malaysianus.AAC.1
MDYNTRVLCALLGPNAALLSCSNFELYFTGRKDRNRCWTAGRYVVTLYGFCFLRCIRYRSRRPPTVAAKATSRQNPIPIDDEASTADLQRRSRERHTAVLVPSC